MGTQDSNSMGRGRFRLTPLMITGLYLGLGGTWLVLTPLLPALAFDNSAAPPAFLLFLLLSAAILFGLLQRHMRPGPQAEKAQRYHETLCRSFLETTQEGIVVLDPRGKLSEVNGRFAALLGYAPEEMHGRPLLDFVAPEYTAAARARLARSSAGAAETYELSLRRRDGEAIRVMVATNPIRDEQQQLLGELMMVTDITVEWQTEEQLREANRELTVLSDAEEALVRATGEDELLQQVCRIIVEDGKYLLAWVGYAEQDEGKGVRLVVQAGRPDDPLEHMPVSWGEAAGAAHPVGRAIRTRKLVVVQDIASDPDFQPWREEALRLGYASLLALPLVTGEQTLGALTIVSGRAGAFDATEIELLTELANDLAYGIVALRTRHAHQRTEEALKYERAFLSSAMDTLPLPIWFFRPDGAIFRTNPAGEEFLRGGAVQNIWDLQLSTPDTHALIPREQRPSSQALQGRVSCSLEYLLTFPDGRQVPILEYAAPIYVDGQPVGGVTALQDITALKEADRAKNRFLAVLTHEMRTPLANILGWVDAAHESPSVVPQALDIIEHNAKRQHDMLENLLEVSRLLLGKLQLRLQPTDLWRLVQLSINKVEPAIAERQLHLELHAPPEALPVMADLKRLRHVIGELLNNAIQFTEPGGAITVSGKHEGGQVSITIADTGRGIPPEQIATLFAPFQQIERMEKVGGLGLGLILSKGVIEAHGGRLIAESAGPGKGSAFTIVLPLHTGTVVEQAS